jgi:hypothetical protein
MINQETIFARKNLLVLLALLGASMILAYAIADGGFMALGVLMALPAVLYVLYKIFNYPPQGLIFVLFLAFSINSLGRYVEGPFGLLIDVFLVLTLIAALFHLKRKETGILKNGTMLVVIIWFLYTVLEIINPEPHSFQAWFFAVRATSLYLLFTVTATFLLFNKEKDMDLFIIIWCAGSLFGALYGIKQSWIGLNEAEAIWLATKGAVTHLIFGELRVFSFYSDAGQFGAIMGFTAVVAVILAVKTESFKKRIFYIITSVPCFYGMMISGTRGALFIPIAGFMVYFVLSKNVKVLVIGSIILGSTFSFLKFTYIGEGSYQIRRMRSAVNPSNDISFQVRLRTQARLSEYLKTRPFGGGIGTVGYWGEKFSPGSFLAKIPPDSWYVLLWAETGIIGLVLYFCMLFYIMGRAFFKIFFMQESYLKQKLMAIFSGMAGIVVASYGNPILGQMPCSIYFYLCIVYLYLGPVWDAESNAIKTT